MPFPSTRLTPDRASGRRNLTLAGCLLGAVFLGCGAHRAGDDAQESNVPIEECDAFVAAYSRCLGTLGPDRIARERAEQTRSGILAQASRGEAARAAVRKQCVDNLSRLNTSCR